MSEIINGRLGLYGAKYSKCDDIGLQRIKLHATLTGSISVICLE